MHTHVLPKWLAAAKVARRRERFLETGVQKSTGSVRPCVEFTSTDEGQPGHVAGRAPRKPALSWPPMPLEAHWERTRRPLRSLTGRERTVAIIMTVVTVLAILVLIVATAGKSRPEPGPGCIRAAIAHVMGAEELNACGARARRLCAQNATREDPNALSIQASCREAGYP